MVFAYIHVPAECSNHFPGRSQKCAGKCVAICPHNGVPCWGHSNSFWLGSRCQQTGRFLIHLLATLNLSNWADSLFLYPLFRPSIEK